MGLAQTQSQIIRWIGAREAVSSTTTSPHRERKTFREIQPTVPAAPGIDTLSIQKNEISFTVARTRHCQFWRRLSAGEWEPHTFEILDGLVSRDTTYLDIGAWIGPTALYAAQRAKTAVAFEPDPLAFKELHLNARLNPQISNLRTCELFIGTGSGTVRIGSEKGLGNSTTSSLFPQSEESCIARAIRLDDFVASERLEAPFFIKIDAEGAEFDILPQMAGFIAQHKPVVCVSLHAFFLDKMLRAGKRSFLLTRRLRCFEAHRRLVASLRKLPYRYDECGKPVNLTWGLLRTLFGKPLVRGNVIVASETAWSESNGSDRATSRASGNVKVYQVKGP